MPVKAHGKMLIACKTCKRLPEWPGLAKGLGFTNPKPFEGLIKFIAKLILLQGLIKFYYKVYQIAEVCTLQRHINFYCWAYQF